MPAKGRRVASRQAQLNRRRRRQARPDSEVAGQTVEMDGASGQASANATSQVVTVSDPDRENTSVSQAQVRPNLARETERNQSPARSAQPMAYTHLGAEFRRIGILAGIVTVVLITVSFVI